jgi:hypothetical protein
MSDEENKPIPLNYARPGRDDARAPAPDPIITVQPELPRGTLSEDVPAVLIFESLDRPEITFSTRTLDQQKIEYRVELAPSKNGEYKRALRIFVRPPQEATAREFVFQTVLRRRRTKELNRQKPDGFKTTAEGGTWPDPFRIHLP